MSSILKVDTIQDQSGNNIINENADTITIGASGDTITIPAGATLSNLGTASGFGLTWQSVQTTGFTAVKGNAYPCDTTSAGFTVTLPATPSAGDQVQLVDYAGTFDTNQLIIDPNGEDIEGGADNLALIGEREGVILTYIDSTQGWIATSGINEGTDALSPAPYSIDFLVVAGGGSGGNGSEANRRAGGGAGGYRTSTQTVNIGTAITVTVGDGGSVLSNGSNSSISGSGLTTITSAGGGAGGAYGAVGSNGGSGGGGDGGTAGTAPGTTAAGGSGNTPSTAPSQGNNGGFGEHISGTYAAGGGGGGAGGVGKNSNLTSADSSNGGAGTASSITGSSVTRAGGGGGNGTGNTNTTGTGGTGGGGNGGNPAGTAGGANTGGGGGSNASGGKGVVILAMPLANFSNTTTGSPTESDDGTTKVLQFNGDGSYTV
jgi:hypothetical protein